MNPHSSGWVLHLLPAPSFTQQEPVFRTELGPRPLHFFGYCHQWGLQEKSDGSEVVRSSLLSLVEFQVTTGGLCAEILHLTCRMRVCSTEPLLPTPPGRLYCVQKCCTRCLHSRWQSSSRDAIPALRSELSPVRPRPLPRRPHPGEQPRPPPDGQVPVLSSGSSVSPLLHQRIKLAFASNLNLASLH